MQTRQPTDDANERIELPYWDANALAAIASALLRRGDLVTGRRLLKLAARKGLYEADFWSIDYRGYWELSWIIALTAQAEGGDVEGAIATAKQRSEPFEQSVGLTLIGEAQAEAGDLDGAWQTFQLAVAASGEPGTDMDTIGLSDIGLGASQTGKFAAAKLIAERLNMAWLSKAIEEVRSDKYAHWYEENPAREFLRSYSNFDSSQAEKMLWQAKKGAQKIKNAHSRSRA